MNLFKIIISILVLTQLCVSEVIQVSSANTTLATTTLRPVFERVFSRKRRFLLMPKGSNLKFTLQVSKGLIAQFPRGFQFSMEAALYYPTFTSRIDLLPKKLRKPTTKKPKPTGTTEPTFVYIPGSLVRYKAKPAIKPEKVQRIDDGAVQWIDVPHSSSLENFENYRNPNKWTQWAKYGGPAYAQKYEWTPAKMPASATHHWQPASQAKWTKWTTEAPQKWKSNAEWPRRERWGRDLHRPFEQDLIHDEDDFELRPYELMQFPDLEEYEDWRHYHSHRDRRQLFKQFEGFSRIFGIDMKSCILRAICDAKRFLLPSGYSMIHDILRVVFNFPTISGLTDDYSHTMKSDFATCDKRLRAKCPFSMLDLLLSPHKGL